jgi:tRNA dimethylallyltransferase
VSLPKPALRCVCLTGPTACGKTELALGLAERLPLEIVSMDSAMVYRGLDIGTAKPSAAARARVPHHLVDIVEPTDTYSAGRFARDASTAIREIGLRGRLPLLVGGTLLYLRALREGLASLPHADDALRAELDAEGRAHGWPALHERLRLVDPAAAARIAPTDRQRIQRALEVHALTGRPLTELQRRAAAAPDLEIATIALIPDDRVVLARRIEQRFDSMVESGFVGEVQNLRARGDLTPQLPALRAVGYRQIWGHLDGAYDWPEARRRALVATRQLAKRQFTWLRGDSVSEQWSADRPGLAAEFLGRVERFVEGAILKADRLC